MEGVLFLWRDEIMFNEKNQFEVFVLKVEAAICDDRNGVI